MIANLTEKQFFALPSTSLHYPCDRCDKKSYGALIRDIVDYRLINDEIVAQVEFTALYLCSDCHWQMTCEYAQLEKDQAKQHQLIMSNEAQWLRKVSHLTVQELADQLGVSRQSYHKWLRGNAIADEHKACLKEMIARYVGDEDEAYFAVGFVFVDSKRRNSDNANS